MRDRGIQQSLYNIRTLEEQAYKERIRTAEESVSAINVTVLDDK